MPISFLNDPTLSDLISSRPVGYKFPVGLTQTGAANTSVDYLIVAGGGGGSLNIGGGGGAGGYLTGSTSLVVGQPYSVGVGGGGSVGSYVTGFSGSNSTFPGLTTAVGGGGGGYGPTGYAAASGGYTIHTFTGDGTFSTNSNFGGATSYAIN